MVSGNEPMCAAPGKVMQHVVQRAEKRKTDRLERRVKEWIADAKEHVHALYEKNHTGQSVGAADRHLPTQSATQVTTGWTVSQCEGRAAELVIDQLAIGRHQAIGHSHCLKVGDG